MSKRTFIKIEVYRVCEIKVSMLFPLPSFLFILLYFCAGDARYHINGNQILSYYLFFNIQVINQDVLRAKSSQYKILSIEILFLLWVIYHLMVARPLPKFDGELKEQCPSN